MAVKKRPIKRSAVRRRAPASEVARRRSAGRPVALPRPHKMAPVGHTRVALIDCDVLLYMAVLQFQEEVGPNKDNEYSYVVKMDHVQNELEDRVKDAMHQTGASHALLATTHTENWRRRVYRTYKENRQMKKPLGFMAAKRWVHQELPGMFDGKVAAHEEPYLEADDLLGLWATNLKTVRAFIGLGPKEKVDTVICGDDKDYRTIPGLLWNPRQTDKGVQKISPIDAVRFHMEQTLMGDPTDAVKGLKGIGPVKARNIIEDAGTSPEVWWPTVVEMYDKLGNGESEALRTAQALRILQYEDYDWTKRNVRLWSPERLTQEAST